MPELLMSGDSTALLQNVVYSLPAFVCHLTSTVVVETSVDNSTWTALTGSNTTGATTSAKFVRCPSANTLVSVKRYR